MVNSNSLTTITDFPLNREIQQALPVTEINDILFVYNEKTDEPIECSYCPEEPNITFRELREALVTSRKFKEVKIKQFFDCFEDLWLNLVEKENRVSLCSANSGYVDKICFARATRHSEKVLND